MPSDWILQMHLKIEITHVPSAGEATALDELLWIVLWKPLGLPRGCRRTFALAGGETELIARKRKNRRRTGRRPIRHLVHRNPPSGRRSPVSRTRHRTGAGSEKGVHEPGARCSPSADHRPQHVAGFFMRQGFSPVDEAPPEHPVFRTHGISFVILEKHLVPECRADIPGCAGDRQECLSYLGGLRRRLALPRSHGLGLPEQAIPA